MCQHGFKNRVFVFAQVNINVLSIKLWVIKYNKRIFSPHLLITIQDVFKLQFTTVLSPMNGMKANQQLTRKIKKTALDAGLQTLRMDGARKVLSGITTVSEVLRVTQSDIV